MKKLMVLAVLMCGNLMAGERVILKDSKVMDAEINSTNVICSSLGYGMKELKINIAALDGFTILDHTNQRFGDTSGLPCMTAGACKRFATDTDAFNVNDIIQNNPRTEKVKIERELVEDKTVVEDENGKRCVRTLTENLKTVVAGIPFFHQRSSQTNEYLPESACRL